MSRNETEGALRTVIGGRPSVLSSSLLVVGIIPIAILASLVYTGVAESL